jgi:hypothetical protein
MAGATKKKTYNLDEKLIHDARKALDARTDTEAILRALRKVVDDSEVERALDRLLEAGRFHTVYR